MYIPRIHGESLFVNTETATMIKNIEATMIDDIAFLWLLSFVRLSPGNVAFSAHGLPWRSD